jgi:hypothetical protein
MERSPLPGSFERRGPMLVGSFHLAAACFSLMACTKVVEPPQAVQAPAHVGEPARITRAANNQARVNLPERSWGLNQGSASAPSRVAIPTRPMPVGAAASLNGDPGGLNREQLQIALQGVMPRLSACFANATESSVVVSFDAVPSGTVRGVTVRGATDAEPCVREVVEAIRFPRFSGNPVAIDYPISVSRSTQVVTTPQAQAVDKPPEAVNP